MTLPSWITPDLWAFFQVVWIDIALAGDNAVVVGLAAAGLPVEQRRKAIFYGILAAAVLRIVFSLMTTQLLAIVGLTLAGGILLLWVTWKMWRELRHDVGGGDDAEAEAASAEPKTLRQALVQIVAADVSMSLDNVLAVAGAARDHLMILVFGLALSVLLTGAAAGLIARLLQKHRWIAYVGLLIILYVALKMIYEGSDEVGRALGWLAPLPPGTAAH